MRTIASVAVYAALALYANIQTHAQDRGPQGDAYVARATLDGPIQQIGTSRRVAVELRRESGGLRVQVTALEGNQFAVFHPAAGSEQNVRADVKDSRGATVRMVAPVFLAGDTGIEIRINPSLGFTEFAGLKVFGAAILSIGPDRIVESDRAGVRGVAFEGSVRHSDCFLAASRSKDEAGREVFDIGALLKTPAAADGAMQRKAGESLDCAIALDGRDGRPYVATPLNIGGTTRIVFRPAPKD